PGLNALRGCGGATIEDLQGRRYLDFHGNYVHQVGFANPAVIAAIKAQLDQLPFCTRRYTNRPAVDLAKKLAALAPGDLNKVLFCPSGTGAIGMALKLARAATGRHKTVSMWDAFHGASLDAISVGGACDRHGALLILDEIPTALGRTGTMFACEHYGVVPDMLVVGKGLGGGILPLAALIARGGLDVAGDRALGHYTHEKNPVACAAALATIECLEEERLLENVKSVGEHVLQRMKTMLEEHLIIGRVSVLGLLMGME